MWLVKRVNMFEMGVDMKNSWKNRFNSTGEIFAFILIRKNCQEMRKMFFEVHHINYFFSLLQSFLPS